jgi:nicotinamide riboside kinase
MAEKLLVVNLYGGPGIGKSTLASSVFAELKKLHIDAELIGEYAKKVVWRGDLETLGDQIYVLGKQHNRQYNLQGKCDVAITDSPFMLSCIYNNLYTNYKNLTALALEAYQRFNNLNYVIERPAGYNPNGRVQTEEQARAVDVAIAELLEEQLLPYRTVQLETAVWDIIADVKEVLNAE